MMCVIVAFPGHTYLLFVLLLYTEIEEDEMFNNYRYRFAMPNSDWPIPLSKMWYSLDIGPIHFLR